MKKVNVCMLGLGLLMAACQSEWPADGVVPEGEGNVIFQVSAPETMGITRAGGETNSALGALTNVDFSQYDLRYQLAVFRIEDGNYVEAVSPQKKIVDSYEPVTYSLRLTPNRNYQVVVWADFVREGETEDLHYNTSDFRNITVPELPDKYLLNDESKDAYYISENFTVEGEIPSLVLKRPFAKLRVVTTDWNYENLEMPDRVEVTYYGCKRFLSLDALTGETTSTELATDDATIYTALLDKSKKNYEKGYDGSDHNRTIVVDYLMTDIENQTPVHMKLRSKDGETVISEQNLKTDIPIQRNWLTTIIGNTLTTGATFNVSIDEGFDNEWVMSEAWWKGSGFAPKEPAYDEATKTYSIYTKEEFMWLPDNVESVVGKTISIQNDIDMSGVNWKPICYLEHVDYVYTVLGNGHTLRNFTMDGTFGAVYVYEKWGGLIRWEVNGFTGVWGTFNGVMKDLTFENITINGLADAMPTEDVDGNPISHDEEAAYFAGCIGYTGANWSTNLNIENVHAKHVHIEASKNQQHVQNVGGLVGWVGVGGGNTWFKNCSASDVNLIGSQVGGFAGQVVGSRYVGFINCSTSDVIIRKTSSKYSKDASGFIGQINDAGDGLNGNIMEINKCTVPKLEDVIYINDTYEIMDYTPKSKYYGNVSKNVDNLKITE